MHHQHQKLYSPSQYLLTQYKDNQRPLIQLQHKIADPPCFYCKLSVGENKCDPNRCDKITAWLLATRGN